MTDNAMDEFWRWFQEHLRDLENLSEPDSPFWDTVLRQLQRVDGRLWFEMSKPDDGIREFIVTAEGKRDAFPIADAVVACAPAVTRWRFIALKPSMGFDFETTYEGIAFDPRAMWFRPLRSNSRPQDLGLRVGVPSLTPAIQRQADNAVLVILDTALGERSAALDIQHVEVCALPETPANEGYIALRELPRYIEWHKRKLLAM